MLGAMVAWVVEVVSGPDTGEQRRVESELEIGRKTLGWKAGGFRLHDRMASRHHARISVDGKTVVLEDLGSTNGTLVNDEEVHSLAVLAAGDLIQVGISILELRTLDQVSAQPAVVHPIPPDRRRARHLNTTLIGVFVLLWFSVMLYLAIGR
jgi:pSer/pThr/pTyr-binding forkhead associated (FHA) protein